MPKPLTTNPALRNVVFKNRWRDVFDGTVPDDWEPTLKVSVVTPAYNSTTLDLTLASLAAQDYPEHLLEVVVVDDGSDPAVEIGEFAPANTRLIRIAEGWGRSNALHVAIEATDGDIIYWVDSDMILFRDNVREHAKWAHFIPEAATIGHKGFVEEWDFTPAQVIEEVRSDEIRRHHDLSTLHQHWSLKVFSRTDDLNATGGRNYSTHMGACATVTRAVYEQTFGQDPDLKLGDDTEIAYQLWQRGAVFIPAGSAQTYHLGRATIQDQRQAVAHFNNVHFAQRMPIPRNRRTSANRQWVVPFITAVVTVDRESARYVRACVDRLLNQSEHDLTVILVGPWDELHDERRRVLADPDVDLYLTREWYRGEGRVTLVTEAPADVFPSPYRLDMPAHIGLPTDALFAMMQVAFEDDLGVTRFLPPDGSTTPEGVTITFTPAWSRARRYVSETVSLEEAIDAVWSVEWKSSAELGMVDLRTAPPAERITRADHLPEVEALKERLVKSKAYNARLRGEIEELGGQRLRDAVRRRAGTALRRVRRSDS